MKKTLAMISTAFLLVSGITFHVDTNSVKATSIDQKLKDVREKKQEVQNDQNTIKNEINKVKEEKAAVESEIKKLDFEMMTTNDQIIENEAEIKELNGEIETLEEEIVVTQERIDERDKLLKERVKAMYVNGGSVSYLEVLLGSKSFGDFLDRVLALTTIAEQDKSILEEQKADKKLLEETKQEVEEKKATVEKKLEDLKQMKKQLETKINEKNQLMSSINEKSEELHAELHELEDAAAIIKAQEKAFIQEKKRQEEAARLAAQQAAQGGGSSSTPVYNGNGMFMRPAQGVFSSGYGQRWGTLHAGVDIAKRGTVPIVAAADGTVIRSYYSSSYGNVVFIAHYINGQTWTTVYAHMRSRSVGDGATVKRGQLLGYMGNTGHSYGQHLHFEIHKGEWNGSKSNSVNPRNYIN